MLSHVPAHADAHLGADRGILTYVVENDVLGEKQEDRNYTNGLKLAWMQGRDGAPAWVRRLMAASGDVLPGNVAPPADTRLEIEIGQTMFTPDDLRRVEPDPLDRPYAGLLYVAAGAVTRRADGAFDQLQLVVGTVGPSSGAGGVQRAIHRGIGVAQPLGWGSQIGDRVVAELRLQRVETRLRRRIGDGGAIELAPHYGASLGNLVTAANAGLTLRVGQNLADIGPPRIAPSLPGSSYFVPSAGAGWQLFGGFDARAVGYNVVLDSPSALGARVARRPGVLDAQAGLAFYWRSVGIAYTQVWRTREYRTQADPLSAFGAISIVWRLD